MSYNLDDVCENCGYTFQSHFYLDCPNGDTKFLLGGESVSVPHEPSKTNDK